MLTITEASNAYPPHGKLPNLVDDGDAYDAAVKALGTRLDDTGDLASAWGALVTWSGDMTSRTHPTWAAAALAATTELLAQQKMIFERKTDPTVGEVDNSAGQDVLDAWSGVPASRIRAAKFANCGQTAVLVLAALDDAIPGLAKMRTWSEGTQYGRANRDDLYQLVTSRPAKGNVLFIDCSFEAVHTFLLEIHPDGRRYLVQGYQGVYFASWWQGNDPEGLVLTKPIREDDEKDNTRYNLALAALQKARTGFGFGNPISEDHFAAFAAALRDAFADGTWKMFSTKWADLPFAPTAAEQDSAALRGGEPTLLVHVFEVPNPQPDSAVSLAAPMVPADVSDAILHLKTKV